MKKLVVGSVSVNHGCIKCHCRLPWCIWCCRPSQWASDVRRCGRRCVCVRATGTCRVVSIGPPISLVVERKLSNDSRNKKLNTQFTNRNLESDLKTRKHFAENGMVAGRFLLYAAVS